MAISLHPAAVRAPGATLPTFLTFWVSSKSSSLSSSLPSELLPLDDEAEELFFFFFSRLAARAATFFLTFGSGSIPVPPYTDFGVFLA